MDYSGKEQPIKSYKVFLNPCTNSEHLGLVPALHAPIIFVNRQQTEPKNNTRRLTSITLQLLWTHYMWVTE